MPTYTVTSASLALTTEQEAVIAAVITHLYHDNTGAPAYFAWSIFSTIENGKHYIGGKTYRTVHLFCLGWSAPAAARMPKAGLITDIATKVQTIASIAGGYPGLHPGHSATQMVEFGRVLPEPGAEEAWRVAITAQKLQDLKAIGAI